MGRIKDEAARTTNERTMQYLLAKGRMCRWYYGNWSISMRKPGQGNTKAAAGDGDENSDDACNGVSHCFPADRKPWSRAYHLICHSRYLTLRWGQRWIRS